MTDYFNGRNLEEDFPALTQSVYLNSAGQGPKPRCVIDRVTYYYEKTLLYGACVPPLLKEINGKVDEVRQKAAQFMGAAVEETAFIRCVAEGVNILLDSLELKEGDEIITSYEENPALLIPLITFAESRKAVIKKIDLPNRKDAILENLKEAVTDRTRLVIMSHVTHTRGLRLPAAELAAVCHENGIWFALDGAQAAGQIAVDVTRMGCDCYFAAGYKWLLGLHGTTVAILSKSLLEKLKLNYNGVGSQMSFCFETDAVEWKTDASRLEYGSRHWPLYVGLGEALDYLSGVGAAGIEAHVSELRLILKAGMSQLGFTCESPDSDELSSGIVTFTKADVDTEKLTAWLFEKKNILIQFRSFARYSVSSKGIRVSLAFYNTAADVEKLLAGIAAYLGGEEEDGQS